MNMNLSQIKKITLGVLDITLKDGYFAFSRFNNAQMSDFNKRGETFLKRANSTSSVKLEFYTRGGNISFDYMIIPGTNREYYSIDILSDGIYLYNVSADNSSDISSFDFNIPFSDTEQRITVYFPTTAGMRIKNLSLPEDYSPHKRKNKILVLGDSKYQGYYPNHFQNTCMNIVSDYFNAQMINQSIGGECFNPDNIYELDFHPDIIIVGYGVNDLYSGRLKNGENADAFFEKLQKIYNNIPAVFFLPNDNKFLEGKGKNEDIIYDQENNKTPKTINDLRIFLEKISSKYKNVITVNAKNFVPQYRECFYGDNVHFTDLGNILCGREMSAAIAEIYQP